MPKWQLSNASPTARPADRISVTWHHRVVVAMRHDATVVTDTSVFFTSDRVGMRATIRVSWDSPIRQPWRRSHRRRDDQLDVAQVFSPVSLRVVNHAPLDGA